jgi:hypothetical protein
MWRHREKIRLWGYSRVWRRVYPRQARIPDRKCPFLIIVPRESLSLHSRSAHLKITPSFSPCACSNALLAERYASTGVIGGCSGPSFLSSPSPADQYLHYPTPIRHIYPIPAILVCSVGVSVGALAGTHHELAGTKHIDHFFRLICLLYLPGGRTDLDLIHEEAARVEFVEIML